MAKPKIGEYSHIAGKRQALHVCHIISSFHPIIGGSEKATERLCKALEHEGVKTLVLTRRQRREDMQVDTVSSILVYRLGYPNRGKLGALTFALHCIWMLIFHFRAYKIVHAQSPDTPLLVGFICKLLLARKLVLTIHGENLVRDIAKTFVGRVRLRVMRLLVDRFTAIQPEVELQLLKLAIPQTHIQRIPNGIDLDEFSPPALSQRTEARQKLNISIKDTVILFVGRLEPVKRIDILLKAWKHLEECANCKLIIVGEGSQATTLRSLADDLDAQVRFDGASDEIIVYLHAADIFVLPTGTRSSSSYEGLSVALLEAMATGLAVIAADSTGNRVFIIHNDNGLLFNVENVTDLARQLKYLVNHPDLRLHLGSKARKSVSLEYSISTVAQQTKVCYQRLHKTNVWSRCASN